MDIWYCNKRMGTNQLSSFLSKLSHSADLSCIYTNHSIRVTAATFLKCSNFSDNQIMSITGHQSVNSLSLYERVSTDEKINMGCAMNTLLSNTEKTPAIEAATPVPSDPPSTLTELVPAQAEPTTGLNDFPEDEEDTDLLKWITENIENIEKQVSNTTNVMNTVTNSSTTVQLAGNRSAQMPMPTFNNCKIGQINFHIHKH